MIVVSDTSPLCYLVLIDQMELLPTLFGDICAPEAVRAEMMDDGAPSALRAWIAHPPSWLTFQVVTVQPDLLISGLHTGESAAITLALQLDADLLIVDEKAARQVATERGLKVAGILGILSEASSRGFVDLPTAFDRLRQTNFRVSPRLLKSLLDEYNL